MHCIFNYSVYKKTGNVTQGTKETQAIPCGKCPVCKKRRASAWSFRLVQEEKRATSSDFITLTYDTNHVPFTENGYMDIKRDHLQNFLKSLRHLQTGRKSGPSGIKYYACGEFGGKTARPHYHIILFNCAIEHIQPAWPHGQVDYGDVNVKSINYCLKYISKSSRVGNTPDDDRTKEFALMSKGLGDNYITPEMIRWHQAEINGHPTAASYSRMYCNLKDGKKIAMPRYYKERIYTAEHRKAIGVKERQRNIIQENLTRSKNPNYSEDLFEAHKAYIRNDLKEQCKNDKL